MPAAALGVAETINTTRGCSYNGTSEQQKQALRVGQVGGLGCSPREKSFLFSLMAISKMGNILKNKIIIIIAYFEQMRV